MMFQRTCNIIFNSVRHTSHIMEILKTYLHFSDSVFTSAAAPRISICWIMYPGLVNQEMIDIERRWSDVGAETPRPIRWCHPRRSGCHRVFCVVPNVLQWWYTPVGGLIKTSPQHHLCQIVWSFSLILMSLSHKSLWECNSLKCS